MKGNLKHLVFEILLIFPFFLSGQIEAEKGVYDLSAIDFQQEEIVTLDGQWEFYKDYLLRPGDHPADRPSPVYLDFNTNWSKIWDDSESAHQFGHGTYRLDIHLPEEMPSMAVMLPNINTAYELYLNGKLIEECGKVGESKESSVPGWQHTTRTIELKPGENEVLLLASNYHHHIGGPSRGIMIGSEEDILFRRNFQIGSLLFLAGCLAIAAIFALGLFWFRPSDKSSLLFMGFCIFYSHWITSSDYHFVYSLFNDIAWQGLIRPEYIALGLAALFYTYFIKLISDSNVPAKLYHLVAGVSVVMIVLAGTTDIAWFTRLLPLYFMFLALSFLLISLVAFEDINISHKLAWVNIFGATALMVVLGHRMLVGFQLVIDNPMINIIGSTIFVFTQAMVLAIRFGRTYRESTVAALAAANTRDEFLNTMSHELKTPMNAILGMTAFLERSELSDQQKDKLGSIRSNAESLLSLINDILSISEVGTGKLKLKKQKLDLESCVESAVSLSSKHRKKDQVKLRVKIDSKIPDALMGDSSRLKQILMHLLGNAFKFTQEGEVRLRVKLLDETREGVNLGFVVADSGTGMSRSISGRYLEVFQKGDIGNARKFGGAGIGLSVVYNLVRMMDGELKVDSKKNLGTKIQFNIWLDKYNKDEAPEIHSIFEKNKVDSSLSILYAEDNPVNQKLIQMMLANLGFEIDIAENGREAVEMARKKYYNIIFMDIQMPEMDGIEATRRIVNTSGPRPIIIALTANLAEVDKPKCFEAGMNDFLHKPVQQEELKLAIIKWQGMKKYLNDTGGDSIKLSS
jgi:signal transduction histidine kinase/CheY-like chemotaxis protein